MRGIAWGVLAAAALAAAGCAGTGHHRTVLDITWGPGWDSDGSDAYGEGGLTPEKRAWFDWYRARLHLEDAQGRPIPPVRQIEFLPEAKANAPVGGEATPAAFVDVNGAPVRIEDYRGRKSLVLVFTRGYPGYICPLCTSYTAQIAHRYPEIAAGGGEVLLVFPGSPEKVQDFIRAAREIAEQEGPGALPFPVLLDVELKAVEAFGIRGEIARPSTYVIDRKGTVRYAFVGEQSHERPDVDTILAELRRAEKAE